jgi:Leucine-rich repeat (LRR) protein
MKTFLLCLLLFCGQLLVAQPVVFYHNSDRERALTPELEKKYGKQPNDNLETPYSIQKRFHDAVQKIIGSEMRQQLSIRAALYLNEQGKADYLFFTLANQLYRVGGETPTTEGLNLDSLSKIVQAGIQPFADSLVSRRTIGRKAVIGIYAAFNFSNLPAGGVPKPAKDSVIRTLAEAVETRDTLKVKELLLSRALLTTVPEVIYRFPNMERLFLADNDIENIRIDLLRLPKLKQLDLSGNILKTDALSFPKNKTLQSLNLLKNQIDDIPPAVKSCKKLETLWLGSNQITRLKNSSFRKVKKIRDLNLYKANLASVPKGISKLKRLEVLDLYYNNIKVLPKSICKLKRLTHLAVSHNQISALPEKIYKLKRVHTLYAHHNHLSKLPERIVQMQNLRILDLGYNWLTHFPDELVAFTNLQELDLSANNFPEFPQQLLQIKKLDKLYLRGNPFLGEDKESKYNRQFSLLKEKNIEVFY